MSHADKVQDWLDGLTDAEKETLYKNHEHNHDNILESVAKYVGASEILRRSTGLLLWGLKLVSRKAPKLSR